MPEPLDIGQLIGRNMQDVVNVTTKRLEDQSKISMVANANSSILSMEMDEAAKKIRVGEEGAKNVGPAH